MNWKRKLAVLLLAVFLLVGTAVPALAGEVSVGEGVGGEGDIPSEEQGLTQEEREALAKNAQAVNYFEKLMESFGGFDGAEPDTYPDWYGGAYIDEADEVLTVYVYGGEDVFAKLAETMGTKDFRTKEAKYSYNELKRVSDVVYDFVVANSENLVAKNSSDGYLSDKDNRVMVGLLDMGQEQQDLFKKEVCDSSCIVFKKSEGSAVKEVDHHPGQRLNKVMGNSDKGYASMGYRVKRGGVEGFVTAGHFLGLNAKMYGTLGLIGTVKSRRVGGTVDAEFVQTAPGHIPTNDIAHARATLSTTIKGTVVGMLLYKSGSTTKKTKGRISSINYRELGLTNLIAAGYESEGGDSGGVVWHYDPYTKVRSTVGIHTGGPKPGYSGPALACKANEINTYLLCYRY